MKFQDLRSIKGYHVHVYFDATTFEYAKTLCETAGQLFAITVGRMHQRPIGPHPCWSCQLAFSRNEYADLLSWLALNRRGLNILIHPLTGNDLDDHTLYASWMGTPQPLNLDVFK